MSIPFLVWLLLSCALLYFSGWTFYILYRQKQVWKSFAQRYDLRYSQGKFFDTPQVNGIYKDYSISLFSGEHVQKDARGNRKLTAIEVELKDDFPMDGALGNGGMVQLIHEFGFQDELPVDYKGWDKEYILRSDDYNMMKAYLSDERLTGLCELMKARNVWLILVFKGQSALLRTDLPDPLQDPKRLDMLLNKLIEVAASLEMKSGEKRALILEGEKPRPVISKPKVGGETEPVEPLSLELEEQEESEDDKVSEISDDASSDEEDGESEDKKA